jgi:hypothetical protein
MLGTELIPGKGRVNLPWWHWLPLSIVQVMLFSL